MKIIKNRVDLNSGTTEVSLVRSICCAAVRYRLMVKWASATPYIWDVASAAAAAVAQAAKSKQTQWSKLAPPRLMKIIFHAICSCSYTVCGGGATRQDGAHSGLRQIIKEGHVTTQHSTALHCIYCNAIKCRFTHSLGSFCVELCSHGGGGEAHSRLEPSRSIAQLG